MRVVLSSTHASDSIDSCASSYSGAVRPPRAPQRLSAGDESPLNRQVIESTATQIDEYFDRRRRSFDLPLHARGTEFQMQVWSALGSITYGDTVTYRDLALMIGRGGAYRAVGSALGANPLPILLPCHRVVASSGRIGGYSGGLCVKRRLLELERA